MYISVALKYLYSPSLSNLMNFWGKDEATLIAFCSGSKRSRLYFYYLLCDVGQIILFFFMDLISNPFLLLSQILLQRSAILPLLCEQAAPRTVWFRDQLNSLAYTFSSNTLFLMRTLLSFNKSIHHCFLPCFVTGHSVCFT